MVPEAAAPPEASGLIRLTKHCLMAAAWSLAAASVARAEPWPAEPGSFGPRPAGGGIAIVPVALWWGLVVLWAHTSDWLSRDSTLMKLRPSWWTGWGVFPFVVLALAAWWIPFSAAGIGIMTVAWLLPLWLYSRIRNPKVPESMRVFTVGHAQRVTAELLESLGAKKKGVKKADDGLPAVTLVPTGAATADENRALQLRLPELPGYHVALKLMQEAVASRATKVLLDVFPDGVRVRTEIDAIIGPARCVSTEPKSRTKKQDPDTWVDAAPFNAEIGKELVAAIRTLAAADAAETLEKAPGFDLEVAGKKRPCKLGTKTLATSRQIVLALDEPPLAVKKLEDLGMSGDLATKVRGLLTLEKGIFIVSSPPLAGCTTTFDAVLGSTDRLLRDFVSIEDSDRPPAEIQNIKPVRFSTAAGETPMAALKKALLEYPKAVVMRDLVDAETVAKLVELADDQTLVIMSIRAGDAIDAIQRLLALKVDREALGRSLLGAVAQRLVRKLCPQCAEGAPPPAELLQFLKLSAEELPEIKKASSFGGCRGCFGRRYVGRTGLFELASGATLRQQLAAEADPKRLRQAALKDGMRALREEGFSAVVAGKTSLEEVQRVFAPPKKEAGPAGLKK